MLNLKAIIIGFILTIIFAMIINSFIVGLGSFISIIISSMIIGYVIKSNLVIGAVHGALIGVFGGLIALIILLLIGGILVIKSEYLGLLMMIFVDIGLGAFGGAIGAIIRRNY